MKVRRYFPRKPAYGKYRQASSQQVGATEREVLPDLSACCQTYTNPYVPGSKIGRGCCSPFAVWCQVDKERVECREHGAEPCAQQQSDREKQNGGQFMVPSDQQVTGCQQEIAHAYQIHAYTDHLCDAAFVYLLAGEKTRNGHPDGKESEEQAAAERDADLLRVDGNVGAGHTIRNGEEQQGDTGGYAFDQDKPVEGDRFTGYRRSGRAFDDTGHQETQCP